MFLGRCTLQHPSNTLETLLYCILLLMKSPYSQFKTRSYDRLSRVYQLLETIVFGPWLQKTRLAHIDALRDAKTVLILGEGDGRFLKQLLKINANCQVDCLDKSEDMLLRTEMRLEKSALPTSNINFIHADALSYSYERRKYDAIVSLFFLDNFEAEQLGVLVPKLVETLKQDGTWLVADFQQPKKGFMRYFGFFLLWIMYRFFRWQTDITARALVNPKHYLATNLQLKTQSTFLAGLLYSEVWSLSSNNITSTQE